jgi:Na+:H+ antiporter, NhaA family
VAPVNETDMALLPEGLQALKKVAKEVGLDLRGAYLNLDGGFDSTHNRKCLFNAGMIPNIKENPRNRKGTKRGRKRLLPLAAGGGGMLVPMLIFVACNPAKPHVTGWGIPMATDIAFVLGILSLLGTRVPVSLKIFLTALAIVDDLGAVLVIAVFYTSDISVVNLAAGGAFLALLLLANALGVRHSVFYGIVGIGGLWLAFLLSGVHATIAGVLAAFTIPARPQIDERGFTQRLKHYLHEFERIEPNDVTLLEPEQMHVLAQIKPAH